MVRVMLQVMKIFKTKKIYKESKSNPTIMMKLELKIKNYIGRDKKIANVFEVQNMKWLHEYF